MNQHIEIDLRVKLTANADLPTQTLHGLARALSQRVSEFVPEIDAQIMDCSPLGLAEESAIYSDVQPGTDLPSMAGWLRDVEALRDAVARLSARYDDSDLWNEVQPLGFSEAIPASLDEWTASLGAVLDSAREQEALWQRLATRGFEPHKEHHMGTSLRLTLKSGAFVWLTGENGDGMPTAKGWTCCAYPPIVDEMPEPIWTLSGVSITCEHEEHCKGQLLDAVDAARATIVAAHGEDS